MFITVLFASVIILFCCCLFITTTHTRYSLLVRYYARYHYLLKGKKYDYGINFKIVHRKNDVLALKFYVDHILVYSYGSWEHKVPKEMKKEVSEVIKDMWDTIESHIDQEKADRKRELKLKRQEERDYLIDKFSDR